MRNLSSPLQPSLVILSIFIFSGCSSSKEDTGFIRTNTSSSTAGERGLSGESCWEAPGVSDQNGDGFLDASDCIGPQGETGKSCWEDIGDINNDGQMNAADCRYSVQQQLSALDVENIVQGNYNHIIVPEDVESLVIAMQKMPSMASSGYYCARIDLEKLCGDRDGCSILLNERHITRGDDLFDVHRWQLKSENYDLFFNPANEDQEYPERIAGIMYRSTHSGSNSNWANTGNPSDTSRRNIAHSQGSKVLLANNSRSDCNNFGSSFSTDQHAESHVFTIAVHHAYMGLITITDIP